MQNYILTVEQNLTNQTLVKDTTHKMKFTFDYLNLGTGKAWAGHSATAVSPIALSFMSITFEFRRGPTDPVGSTRIFGC